MTKKAFFLLFVLLCTMQCRKDQPLGTSNTYPYKGVIIDDNCVGYIKVIRGQSSVAVILNLPQSDTLRFYSFLGDSLQTTPPHIKYGINDTFSFNVRKFRQSDKPNPVCQPADLDYLSKCGFITGVKNN